jgi:hypothetical protein
VAFVYKLLKSGDGRLKKEVYRLPFNSSFEVRAQMSRLLNEVKQPLLPFMHSYIEDCLRKTGFRVIHGQLKGADNCVWYDDPCDLALKKARIVLLAPRYSCLERKDLDFKRCSVGHMNESAKAGKHEAKLGECYMNNFDSLVELSPVSKHVLELFAFQYKPFPFYITEVIQDHRLLDYLLDHRESGEWLSRDSVLEIAAQVREGLQFLNDRQTVLRDVCAYNLLVVDHGHALRRCDVLPSGRFKLRFADLGLLHHNSSNSAYEYDDVVRGMLELRVWTSVIFFNFSY